MPIYDFECSHCQHKAELMRKISESSLTSCPACGKESFSKQISAPSFQLNGTGWYATDFKGSHKTAAKSDPTPAALSCSSDCACH